MMPIKKILLIFFTLTSCSSSYAKKNYTTKSVAQSNFYEAQSKYLQNPRLKTLYILESRAHLVGRGNIICYPQDTQLNCESWGIRREQTAGFHQQLLTHENTKVLKELFAEINNLTKNKKQAFERSYHLKIFEAEDSQFQLRSEKNYYIDDPQSQQNEKIFNKIYNILGETN